MSNLGCSIRACWNVKVIHSFWHLASKMLHISIVISFSKPVWDYRLHLHDVWCVCVCFYGIKWLTFKLVQLLMLEGREWYFLPAFRQHSPLLSAGKKPKAHILYVVYKDGYGNISTQGTVGFLFFMSFLELNLNVCFCGLCPLVKSLLSVLPNVVCTVSAFFEANKTKAVQGT